MPFNTSKCSVSTNLSVAVSLVAGGLSRNHLTFSRSLISSTNLKSWLTRPKSDSRSSMNIRTWIGPSIKPRGTPLSLIAVRSSSRLQTTRWLLPFNHSRIQLKTLYHQSHVSQAFPLTCHVESCQALWQNQGT